MIPEVEILLISSAVAVSCSILGVYLVLRKISLLSDAISHAILLGIVLAFFVVKDLASPVLIFGAATVGLLTVFLTEALIGTKKLKEDASIGLVFPVLFAIGVLLISRYAGQIHLDIDAVLLGELAFAPFDRLVLMGLDLPKSLWVMLFLLVANVLVLVLLHKEIKLTIFDNALAISLGISATLIHYVMMFLVSMTAVGAFDAVGAVLVVALFITPPATAYLLTDRYGMMIFLSAVLGMTSAILGYGLAFLADASIAGAMVMVAGGQFAFALVLAPERGLLWQFVKYKRNRLLFSAQLLLVHLFAHEGTKIEGSENTVQNALNHMQWEISFAEKVANVASKNLWVERKEDRLFLTVEGREKAKSLMMS